MRARFFDEDTGAYFVSEVFAIVNSGTSQKYLVVQEIDGKKFFRFIKYLNSNEPLPYRLLIKNKSSDPWIRVTEKDLVYFRPISAPYDKNKNYMYQYDGYQFIFEQRELLYSIFKGKRIPYETIMGDKKEICSKLDGWNYVESNDDIEYLMDSFIGFHDSVLVSLNYISGSKRVDKGMHVFDDIRQVSMIFDGYSKVIGGSKKSIELVFEGTVLLNLRPSLGIRDSIIYSATITLKDNIISFYDGDVAEYPEDHEYTWIKAYGLRWRVLSEGEVSSNFVCNG